MTATVAQMAERVLARCKWANPQAQYDTPPEGECWVFQGAKSGGYGRVGTYDKATGKQLSYQAHRIVYEHFVGPIGEGLVLDHLCKNRACVNPQHLDPITVQENTDRAVELVRIANAERVECDKGHRLTSANTYTPRGTAKRQCRECARINARKWKNKKRDRYTR